MNQEKAMANAALRAAKFDALQVQVYTDRQSLAASAAHDVAGHLREILAAKPEGRAILATGNSQIEFLDRLIALGAVDWRRMLLFHMDEYLGLPANHPSSFRSYMQDHVVAKVNPKAFHFLSGDALEPIRECERYQALLREQPVDLCCLGIGDNGHLAFNDPPVANFNDPTSVKIIRLDKASRQQQANQGHFPSAEAVPPYALTLTVPALCAADRIICLAPGGHKAEIVRRALTGPISTDCPASILRRQAQATLYLDQESARLLPQLGT